MSHVSPTARPGPNPTRCDVPPRIELDDLLGALAHRERRRLLATLANGEPSEDPGIVLGSPDDRDPAAAAPHAALLHVHLPRLEATGLISLDRETLCVTRGPRFEAVRPLVEFLRADSRDPIDA
jgi:hypothetical protein